MGSDREGKMHVDMVGVDPGDVLRVSAEVRVSDPGELLRVERYRLETDSLDIPTLSMQGSNFNAVPWRGVPQSQAKIEHWSAERGEGHIWIIERTVHVYGDPMNQKTVLVDAEWMEFKQFAECDFNEIEFGELQASVPVRAVLRDSRTGKTGEERYEVEPKYAANQLFQWTEGNYSCDCNRSRFLNGADGVLECNTGENVIELVELWVGGERLI